MKSVDIRTAVVVVAFSAALAGANPMTVSDPFNDFVMYYDVTTGVDRSPHVYPEEYSVWLYTPPARSLFRILFSPFRHFQDAHRFWSGLNMLAILAVLLVSARRGWMEIALVLPVLSVGLGLWMCGNIAPLLTAISLTPLGAIVSCGIKPYFLLFVCVHFADRLRRRSTWMALSAATFLACYSVLGLTDAQRSFIAQHRLLAHDYLYVMGVLFSFAVTRFGPTFAFLTVLPSFKKKQPAPGALPPEE